MSPPDRSGASRVAYLVNLYPAPSHAFIRREILALEAAGWQVHRFAHRRSATVCVDPEDLQEEQRTVVLLDAGMAALIASVGRWLLARPAATLATLRLALQLAARGDRRFVAHLGYFVLACTLSHRLRVLGGPHLHAHFGTNPAAVARLSQRLCGTTYSVTFHGPHEFARPDTLNLDEKMSGASFVAAVSETGVRLLQARYPRHAAKVLLVRCGLDGPWWQRPATPIPSARRLACVARLDAQKDPLLLIDAAALAVARGCSFELVIAGDGPLRADVERRIAERGLGGAVRLLGWCTGPQVAALLESARALVLSSRGEGLPVAVMEAFACGRPAIAPDVGGVNELVQDGRTGWLVTAGDPSALAHAMQACVEAPPAQLQSLGATARERVQRHAIQASAATLAQAFQGAAAK
jgi:colanic acid/amylovoran biosynthesis glycosyltransferase